MGKRDNLNEYLLVLRNPRSSAVGSSETETAPTAAECSRSLQRARYEPSATTWQKGEPHVARGVWKGRQRAPKRSLALAVLSPRLLVLVRSLLFSSYFSVFLFSLLLEGDRVGRCNAELKHL